MSLPLRPGERDQTKSGDESPHSKVGASGMKSNESSLPRPTEPRRSLLQFTLRTLLILTTVTAILCGLLFPSPA